MTLPQFGIFAQGTIAHEFLEFDLRPDVKFQNGESFGADDVKYSFDYVLNPENKALRRPLFDRIAEVIVENPLRVRFRLREPYRPWLYYMTKYMGIFPKGSREKHDAAFFKNAPVGVGTGPGQRHTAVARGASWPRTAVRNFLQRRLRKRSGRNTLCNAPQ